MIALLYLGSSIAFIVGLRRLGGPRTARSGNRIAAIGMLAAIVITLVNEEIASWGTVIAGLIVGTILGIWAAVPGQDDRNATDGCGFQRIWRNRLGRWWQQSPLSHLISPNCHSRPRSQF